MFLKNLKNSQSVFFDKVAKHLQTTASVIPSFQYTLFISHSIFYFNLEYLRSHGLSVWKLLSTCLLNPLSASCFLMICATWLIDFQMVVLHEVEFCLFSYFSATKKIDCWDVSGLSLGTIWSWEVLEVA